MANKRFNVRIKCYLHAAITQAKSSLFPKNGKKLKFNTSIIKFSYGWSVAQMLLTCQEISKKPTRNCEVQSMVGPQQLPSIASANTSC